MGAFVQNSLFPIILNARKLSRYKNVFKKDFYFVINYIKYFPYLNFKAIFDNIFNHRN